MRVVVFLLLSTMRGIVQTIPGDSSTLVLNDDVPIPQIKGKEILIRVQFVSVNKLDVYKSEGHDVNYDYYDNLQQTNNNKEGSYSVSGYYDEINGGNNQMTVYKENSNKKNKYMKEDFNYEGIYGMEVSGTVSAIGSECTKGFQHNELVIAIVNNGGYSEFCVADERLVFRSFKIKKKMFGSANNNFNNSSSTTMIVPESVTTVYDSLNPLVCYPRTLLRAYQLLFIEIIPRVGDTILIHQGNNSTALIMLQMLKNIGGINVFVTVFNTHNYSKCLEYGAKGIFNLSENPDFSTDLLNLNNNNYVDVVIDSIGGDYMGMNLDVIRVEGKVIMTDVSYNSFIMDEHFLLKVLSKRVILTASTFDNRSIMYKEQILESLLHDEKSGLKAVENGDIALIVDQSYQLEDVQEAHAYIKNHDFYKNVALTVTSTGSVIDNFRKELKELEDRIFR